MSDWKTLSSDIVYETPWIKVRRDEVLNQNGKPLTYSYVELQNSSAFIVALNTEGQVLIQNVYRYTLGHRIWEIPAGFVESGEEPLAAAKRELMEETGFQSDDWRPLGRINQVIGIGKVPLNLFLAINVSAVSDATDKEEDISDRRFVSIEELERMIAEGELIDCPVIAALYMTKIHLSQTPNH
jgi:8-oxo-dGTP pyrophosphatase MutT (NUDIX family)